VELGGIQGTSCGFPYRKPHTWLSDGDACRKFGSPQLKYSLVLALNCRTVAALPTHIAVSPRMWFEVHGKQRVKTLVGFDFVGLANDVKAEKVKPRTGAIAQATVLVALLLLIGAGSKSRPGVFPTV
jgi:hypothetical protein